MKRELRITLITLLEDRTVSIKIYTYCLILVRCSFENVHFIRIL